MSLVAFHHPVSAYGFGQRDDVALLVQNVLFLAVVHDPAQVL